eukprot:TRINITY_DN55310_c0_g1_i1.p1 TRINITY_DN55310_c0_g1~~TRINITY_DN55310_c0_g1_i1.p1  ORF type:complete len:233 (-),score=49.06 TRINITY_DN55310_c0_g1_i1:42-740(-)
MACVASGMEGEVDTQIKGRYTDYEQLERDASRSLWSYTLGWKERDRKLKRESLMRIMNYVLCQHPELNYYQGFHDICGVCLMVCGERVGAAVAEYVATHHLQHNMLENFDVTMKSLELMFELTRLADPDLHWFLLEASMMPSFAVSWVLTWFSHNLSNTQVVARLFDLFIFNHPLMSVYVSASVLMAMRHPVLQGPCEFTAVYSTLQKLPQDLDMAQLIDCLLYTSPSPRDS